MVALLNDLFGIQSRGGCSCAGPYGHDLLQLDEEKSHQYMVELSTGNTGSKTGWVRLNFNYFIPREEFDYITQSLIWISENGWKLLNLYHFDDHEGLWTCKNEKKITINSISSFLTNKSKLKKGNSLDKNIMRKAYFKFADELAKRQLEEMKSKKFQAYQYNQIENPLRWYSLVQDCEEILS